MFYSRVLSDTSPITVLQWNFTGELLLVANQSGCIKIYKNRDHLLNDWSLVLKTELQGEHILAAAFFHCGKKVTTYLCPHSESSNRLKCFDQICLNSEKKDSPSYIEKFQHVKFAASVKQFGGRPANGCLLLTTTGMLAAILLPQATSQTPMVFASESLGATRVHIKTADICYGKSIFYLISFWENR